MLKNTVCLSVLCAAVLAGCAEPPPPQPGPTELALVTRQIETELNKPINLIRKDMVSANRDGEIVNSELSIAGDGQATPVDWWVVKQGFMKLGGIGSIYPYFVLTPEGEAFTKSAAPWLTASFQKPPTVVCAGAKSWASCRVTGTAVIKPAAVAGQAFEGIAMPPQPFTSTVEYGPQGWRAGELTLGQGSAKAYALAHALTFGDRATIEAEWMKFADKANRQLAAR